MAGLHWNRLDEFLNIAEHRRISSSTQGRAINAVYISKVGFERSISAKSKKTDRRISGRDS